MVCPREPLAERAGSGIWGGGAGSSGGGMVERWSEAWRAGASEQGAEPESLLDAKAGAGELAFGFPLESHSGVGGAPAWGERVVVRDSRAGSMLGHVPQEKGSGAQRAVRTRPPCRTGSRAEQASVPVPGRACWRECQSQRPPVLLLPASPCPRCRLPTPSPLLPPRLSSAPPTPGPDGTQKASSSALP